MSDFTQNIDDAVSMGDARTAGAAKGLADSLSPSDLFDWWLEPPPTTTTTTSSTTTDPPLSVDSPVLESDAHVSGSCPSGSDVSVLLLPSGRTATGGFTEDTDWYLDGVDLTGQTEVRASADGWASYVSEPIAPSPFTSTPAPVTDAPATTAPPMTTAPPAPPGPPSYLIVHGNTLTAVAADGTALSVGPPFEFAVGEPESSSVAAAGGSMAAVVWHEGWGGGRCRMASIGDGEIGFGEQSQLEGTAQGAYGLSSLVRMGPAVAVAYRDGGDCLGKASLAQVGGYQVTTTTAPPTTTTSTTTTSSTTSTTSTTTAGPGPTTTAPPPPGAPGGGFMFASPHYPILPASARDNLLGG